MLISKEALFKVVSTRFGLRIVENSIENPHFIFCSVFQNLRLGSIIFPIISTTNRGSPPFWENREQAGLWGMSCRRLMHTNMSQVWHARSLHGGPIMRASLCDRASSTDKSACYHHVTHVRVNGVMCVRCTPTCSRSGTQAL